MNGEGTGPLDSASARELATSLTHLYDAARQQVMRDSEPPDLVRRVTDHVGCPLSEMPNVTMRFDGWEQLNVQRGVDAYLAAYSPAADWFGVSGAAHSGHQDMAALLAFAGFEGRHYQIGAVDYTTVASGPNEVTEAIQLGLVRTVAPDGTPVVVGVRGPMEHAPENSV